MGKTTIRWFDVSINPIRAHVSMNPIRGDIKPFLDSTRFDEVLRRKKPRKYVWCDRTDIFGEWVPDAWIDQIAGMMWDAHWHTHIILSKHPERMQHYFASKDRAHSIACASHTLFQARDPRKAAAVPVEAFVAALSLPLHNLWLGTSIENQATADERIPFLLQTPAAIRFLSAEPLLEAIDFRLDHQGIPHGRWGEALGPCGYYCDEAVGHIDHRTRIDQIICGGESGPHARPCDLSWIEDIIAQCDTAGISCFIKQLGARPWMTDLRSHEGFPAHIYSRTDTTGSHPSAYELHGFKSKAAADPLEWPAGIRVQEFPVRQGA
jgi:protein gp37